MKFGYGINSKNKGMLAHSFDRFYVVTKFILPTMNNLKLSPIKYDKECKYLHDLDDKYNEEIKENATIQTTTIDIIPIRNSPSTNQRQKY